MNEHSIPWAITPRTVSNMFARKLSEYWHPDNLLLKLVFTVCIVVMLVPSVVESPLGGAMTALMMTLGRATKVGLR